MQNKSHALFECGQSKLSRSKFYGDMVLLLLFEALSTSSKLCQRLEAPRTRPATPGWNSSGRTPKTSWNHPGRGNSGISLFGASGSRNVEGTSEKIGLAMRRSENSRRLWLFPGISGVGRCERVLRFMGREVQGRQTFRMQAVKRVVAKLQNDKTASFCREMSGREVTGRYIGIPVFHGTLLPMDFWAPPLKGAQTMKCKLWTETLEFLRLKVPNSPFALHGLAPP